MSDSGDHLTHIQALVAGMLGDGGSGGAAAGPTKVQHYSDPKKRAKKPKKKTPKDIEHERDQKRAGTVYHNQQKKQESRKGTKFSHTIKWVKPPGAKRGKWVHDVKGTHTYTHHADGTHTITASVKEMRERLRARVLNEMVPGSATEKYGKMAAKMSRLEKRGIKNHPQYPRDKTPETVANKQKKRASYLKGSLTKIKNRGDNPDTQALALTKNNNWTVRPKNNQAFATNKDQSTEYVKPGKPRKALNRLRRRKGYKRDQNAVSAFLDAAMEEFSLYEQWLTENKPADREIGKPTLTRIYAADTPGQGGVCEKCKCKDCKCKGNCK